MRYTIHDLQADFSSENACLEFIFRSKYPQHTQYYRISDRKSYVNAAGHQIHPLAGTIFEKSSTPLTSWFYALYLFSVSKNGVSAKELQRQLGVTYKTAWRMAAQIRALMDEDGGPLSGMIETDEAFVGPKTKRVPVIGAVQRGGRIKARVMKDSSIKSIYPFLRESTKKGSVLISDSAGVFKIAADRHRVHHTVNHSKGEYVRGKYHTNTIEAFWSNLKRSVSGTYHYISPKHAQTYINEFSYRYNQRFSSVPIFLSLLARI